MRGNTKIGDIFVVKINENFKKDFQFITTNLTQLNSDVIRVFKKEYPINSSPTLSEIVHGEVDFYAYCVTKVGIGMKYWERIGNIKVVGVIDHILFRSTDEYGKQPPIKLSQKWWVWRINKEAKFVGKLEGDNRNAEIGLVINPESIVYRIKNGKYDFPHYPNYE